VAGADPCSPAPVASEAQRRVIRSLGFHVPKERVEPSVQDEYNKLFLGPISDSQLAALSALFGWTVDEGMMARSDISLEGI
jgi:hypothetical protein